MRTAPNTDQAPNTPMSPLILRVAAAHIKPVLILFSLYLLSKGHNEPGGGFVGGLVAASAFLLHLIAYDAAATRKSLPLEPHALMGIGLLLAAGSSLAPLFWGESFFKGLWFDIPLWPGASFTTGTPQIFDIGVYLVVLGTMLVIFLNLKDRQ